jgi:hypothetical protein
MQTAAYSGKVQHRWFLEMVDLSTARMEMHLDHPIKKAFLKSLYILLGMLARRYLYSFMSDYDQ